MDSGARWKTRARQAALAGAVAVMGLSSAGWGETLTVATWVNPISGNWTDATKWSTSPFYPQYNNPINSEYDAVIGVAGSYLINLDTSASLHSFTLNSPSVTFQHSLSHMITGTLDVASGTYNLEGGSISFQTLNIGAAGDFRAGWGQLNGGTINGTLFTGAEGKTITLGSGWRNEGVIRHSAGTLGLSGVFSTDDIGAIERTGRQIVIAGALSNAGSILESGDWSGPLLITGEVNDGILRASETHPITLSNAQLYGVTVDGGSVSSQSGLRVANLTISTGSRLDVSTSITFGQGIAVSHQILAGGGELALNQARVRSNVTGTSITLGSDVIVSGTGTIDVGVLTSNGTLIAQGGSLVVSSNWTNSGMLKAVDGGTLRIQGTLAPGGLARLDSSGGTIVISGTANNAGNTLVLDGPQETLHISGSLNGGTIQTANGAKLLMASSLSGPATLDDVVIDTDVHVADGSSFRIAALATLTPGHQVHMVGTDSRIDFHSNFSGEILLESNTALGSQVGSSVNLDIGPGVVVRTAGGNGSIGSQFGTQTRNNYGLISAESTGNSIRILGSSQNIFNNYGTLQVSAGSLSTSGVFVNHGAIAVNDGTFTLGGGWDNNGSIVLTGGRLELGGVVHLSNIGTFTRLGGTVALTGMLHNPGSTADFTSIVGPWQTGGVARIVGGSIVSPIVGQPFLVPEGFLVVDGASLDTDVMLMDGSSIMFDNQWAQNGVIGGNAGSVTYSGSFATGSIGSLNVTNSKISFIGIINNSGATLPLVAGSGSTFTLHGGKIIGGTVGQVGQLLNVAYGTFDSVTLAADVTLTDGALFIHDGLTGMAGSKINLIGDSLMEFYGSAQFDGASEVVFEGSNDIPVIRSGFGVTSTIGTNVLIRTGANSGMMGDSFGKVLNQGTISSRTALNGITLLGTFSNSGLLESRNGGTISLPTTLTNFSAGSLNGGRWAVYANSTMTMGSSTITTNNADILLDGLGSTFVPINSIRTNLGSFAIDHGRNFTTVGSFTNSGYLGIGMGSNFHVTGDLDNSGSINLNGTLIVDGSEGESDMLEALRDQLLAGYNNGAWNGPGIHSSLAAGQAGSEHPTALGYADVAGAAQITYTWTGDTDLNGVVNAADLGNLAMHWSSSGDWLGGDFNYDGIVNIRDLVLLAVNWQMDGTSLGAALESAGLPSVVVPDPVSVSFLALLLPWSLKRPCRRE